VVAFNTGGLSDIVDHQRTGYLAAAFETEDLAAGIRWVLSAGAGLRENARERAVKRRERRAPERPDADRPEESTAMRERVIALYRAMDELPEDQRAALAMLSLRGLPAARIAEILEVPEGTVYSRAHAARRAIRRALPANPSQVLASGHA
jgi:RNA polymerase sigma factor (sigma-70 family)